VADLKVIFNVKIRLMMLDFSIKCRASFSLQAQGKFTQPHILKLF